MPYEDKILKWMSDWADQFAQEWTDEELTAFSGKRVSMLRPADEEQEREEKVFTFNVVGWSQDRLLDPESGLDVSKWSLLTDEGNQVAIYSGSALAIVDD